MKNNRVYILAGASLGVFFLLKKRSQLTTNIQDEENSETPAVDGIGIILQSKEWYGLMDAFEKSVNKIVYTGGGFKREDRELWKTGYYYTNGKVNELFKVFMSGYELGTAGIL